MHAARLRGLFIVLFLSTAGRTAEAVEEHCLTLATGAGYGAIVRSGDSDAYTATEGANLQLETGYTYCGFRFVRFGGGLHYFRSVGTPSFESYDFLSIDAVVGVHASFGPVDVGVRGGPGILLFFKPTTYYYNRTVAPDTSVLFTPFIGPELMWWVSRHVGVAVLGDFRLSPFESERRHAESLGGLVGATLRY
jgi:hypothetical protein